MKLLVVTANFLRSKNDMVLDFVFEFVREFARQGHEVMVVAAHDDSIARRETIDGVMVRRYAYFFPKKLQKLAYGFGIAQNLQKSNLAKLQVLPYLIAGTLETGKAIKEFKPDVVQALWTFPQGIMTGILKNFLNFKLALHVFGAEPYLAKKHGMEWIVKWPVEKADFVSANSEATRQATIALNVKKPVLNFWWGGVSLKRFNPKNNGGKVRKKLGLQGKKIILGVGRLVERKGFVFLVQALKEVLKKESSAVFLLVGKGVEEEKIRQTAEGLEIQDKVVLAGTPKFEELPEYYAACDVFCLPAIIDSKGETEGGQALVIAEAMASRKPVVAGNVGGIPEIVKHGKTGLLVEQKNVSELSSALLRVLQDKKLAGKLAENGFKHVKENLEWGRMVEKCVENYKKAGLL